MQFYQGTALISFRKAPKFQGYFLFKIGIFWGLHHLDIGVTVNQRPVVTVDVSDSLQLTSACNIVWQCVTMCCNIVWQCVTICYDITHVRIRCVFVTSHCWFGPPCPAVTLLWFSRSDVNQNRQYILCSPNSEYCIHICPEYCEYTGTCVSRKAEHTDIFNKHQISGWLPLARH